MAELGYPPNLANEHTTAGSTEQWAIEQSGERACNRGIGIAILLTAQGIFWLIVGIVLGVVLS